ncbi:myb-like transcription factor family protein [Senna tora]|uniref:Myb-like transcription factor family protein n=1 Tax=Senna tora TaxID=362788 RepID=A0A834SK37_9FABA|nr:myb-like transcription factor family protein [Senna tora]
MEFRDYIKALEQERLKIQVFSKELPLSLELITQAIEACKQQLSGTTTEYNLHGQSECSEQTTSMEEGPVLEEFIPIKKREKDGQGQRKQQRCWSPELHKRFLQVLQQLGDAEEEREAQG